MQQQRSAISTKTTTKTSLSPPSTFSNLRKTSFPLLQINTQTLTGIRILLRTPEEGKKKKKQAPKMNGYSKIRTAERRKTSSVDFSDLALSPPAKVPQTQMSKTTDKIGESFPDEKQRPEQEEKGKIEEDVGERFGAILSRSCSVSSTTSASQRFGEKNPQQQQQQSYGVQSALKRAFSLRRSSSASEGYCRIHDQWAPLSPPPPCDGDDMQARSIGTRRKKEKKRGGFVKACKRLFGFP